jgi:membrane protein YqaA with SNARE-associated domain
METTKIPQNQYPMGAFAIHMDGIPPRLSHSLLDYCISGIGSNVLGACINWLLGRYLEHFKNKRWFPVKEAALDKAARTYQRYGVWSLLLSWVPIIGDPLTVIAGLLRTPFPLFVLLVTCLLYTSDAADDM